MTEPLDIDALRARAFCYLGATGILGPEPTPNELAEMVVRLCDEVERLRRVECVHLWVLEIDETETWIRCVNCDARTTQSEAPAVSEGGCAACQHSAGEHDSVNDDFVTKPVC